jgi:hypothetical protein
MLTQMVLLVAGVLALVVSVPDLLAGAMSKASWCFFTAGTVIVSFFIWQWRDYCLWCLKKLVSTLVVVAFTKVSCVWSMTPEAMTTTCPPMPLEVGTWY